MVILSIIIPCFNEEAVLPETSKRLKTILDDLIQRNKLHHTSHIVFVDDGSHDRTWTIIRELSQQASSFRGIKLSRNRGQQNAMLAGLFNTDSDIAITIDADLQDDLHTIEDMLDEHAKGMDIVYGVRKRRDNDNLLKRIPANTYYALLQLLGIETIPNHSECRLMSRRAISALKQFKETNLFLRGIVPLLGFPASIVYYDRQKRFAGESKYPTIKLIGLAWQGISSFSSTPLHIITGLGVFISLFSLGLSFWALWVRLFTDNAVPGWASTVVPMYFLGGIQLLSIGILGEYIAKVYGETKRRPAFFLEEQAGFSQQNINNGIDNLVPSTHEIDRSNQPENTPNNRG